MQLIRFLHTHTPRHNLRGTTSVINNDGGKVNIIDIIVILMEKKTPFIKAYSGQTQFFFLPKIEIFTINNNVTAYF